MVDFYHEIYSYKDKYTNVFTLDGRDVIDDIHISVSILMSNNIFNLVNITNLKNRISVKSKYELLNIDNICYVKNYNVWLDGNIYLFYTNNFFYSKKFRTLRDSSEFELNKSIGLIGAIYSLFEHSYSSKSCDDLETIISRSKKTYEDYFNKKTKDDMIIINNEPEWSPIFKIKSIK